MKKLLKLGILFAVVLAGSAFIVSSFLKASRPPQAAEPPVISAAPVKVFGVIEPAGREVFVGPPLSRRIISVHAVEGDTVVRGQLLAELENSVERAQVALNETKIELARKAIELEADSMKRSQQLYKKNIDSEYTYTQTRLRKELEEKRLAVSSEELKHAQAQLEQTMLRSPIDGMIYKFDVRLGETLQSGDNSRIILGEKGYWARMWVESFWRERITPRIDIHALRQRNPPANRHRKIFKTNPLHGAPRFPHGGFAGALRYQVSGSHSGSRTCRWRNPADRDYGYGRACAVTGGKVDAGQRSQILLLLLAVHPNVGGFAQRKRCPGCTPYLPDGGHATTAQPAAAALPQPLLSLSLTHFHYTLQLAGRYRHAVSMFPFYVPRRIRSDC